MLYTLITTLYNVKDTFRLLENKQTIMANLENKYIEKIIVFFQDYDPSNPTYNFLIHKNIEIIPTTTHQTYKELFSYANNKLQGKIVIIANTDIMFDNTINRLDEINFHPTYLCALTRWEKEKNSNNYKLTLQDNKNVSWSFDSYIFESPLLVDLDSLDIKIGVPGCDSLLIKRFCYDNLFTVSNPCIDIRTYHMDNFERVRTYDISGATYFNDLDYPAPWNKNFPNLIQNIKYKTNGYIGLKATTVDEDDFNTSSTLNNLIFKKQIKVISFCLWGVDPRYTIGAIKNAALALELYPTWECWFYIHTPTVPLNIISELKKYPNVKIIEKTDMNNPMMWRFEAIDDPSVSAMLSRDTDTRILLREKLVVEEWLKSGKTFHIMRDHPHHTMHILGGMFGTKKITSIPSWTALFKNISTGRLRDYDQDFLRDYIYPRIKDDCLVHTSFHKKEGEFCKDFNTEYEDYHHVGEYVFEHENRSQPHIEVLKEELQKIKK